jgi:hypothetical protein
MFGIQRTRKDRSMSEVVEIRKTDLEVLRLAKTHDDKTRELEREVTIAKGDWDEAKDASLAAKKHYDKLVNELRSFIAEGPGKQMTLPGLTTAEPTEFSFAKVQSWQDKSIDCLDIDDKMKDKLREIGVETLGQAMTLKCGKAPGYPNGAADIPRWKSKKAGEFEDALNSVTPNDPAGMIPDADDEINVVEDDPQNAPEESSGIRIHAEAELETVRIKLAHDIKGMEEDGLVTDAEFDAKLEGESALVKVGTEEYILSSNEFAILHPEAAEAV